MRICDVGVNLGGADVGVAEESLDGANVGAIHEEIGSKGVTESVRTDVFSDASEFGVFLDDALNGAGGKATIIARSVNGLLIFAVVEEEGGKGIFA